MRPAENGQIFLQRRGIVNQAERVHRAHIGQQFTPPEAGFDSNRRNIGELMGRGFGRRRCQSVIGLQKIMLCSSRPEAARHLRAATLRGWFRDSCPADTNAAYRSRVSDPAVCRCRGPSASNPTSAQLQRAIRIADRKSPSDG